MLNGLPPLVNRNTRLLIVGSFPGVKSLGAQAYYAHPQNQFWRIVHDIFNDCAYEQGADSYQIRSDYLLSKGVGLWDVYAACERQGSLDQHIRQPRLNDFSELVQRCPALQAVAHNGKKSFHLAPQVRAALTLAGASQTPASYPLPSSSAAHAAMPFKEKVAAWRAVFAACGLC